LHNQDHNNQGSLGWLTNIVSQFSGDWWVEISTHQPKCVYYFGPFTTAKDAEQSQSGYIEDLQQEGAEGIAVSVKRCNPKELTVIADREYSSTYS
jgi:hypothetical protein